MVELFLKFALLGAEWVMWLLVALSVLSIAIMIDRALWFRGKDADVAKFRSSMTSAVDNAEVPQFLKKHGDSQAIPVQVALAGLRERERGADAVSEAMQAEKSRWRTAGERNLIILGTLGNNVPFIGLFGTVLGIIKAFNDLKSKSSESESLVMAGIAEALVATAIGLLVAIPAVVAFNYFQRRVKVILSTADEAAHTVMMLANDKRNDGAGRERTGASA